jgi:hypothetical protein
MNILSDKEIVLLCNQLYLPNGGDKFDFYDPGTTDGICWAVKKIDGVVYIGLRGSVTVQDWLRDFTAIADPFSHAALGPCHPGFLKGLNGLWQEIKAKYGNGPYVVFGHSLGAGRTCILVGMMVLDGAIVLRRVCFGEPKPAFQKLANIIKSVPAVSYRNGDTHGHDVVTDVPLSIPPQEYVHPVPLISVCASPTIEITLKLGVFAFHHMPLYVEALNNVKIKKVGRKHKLF